VVARLTKRPSLLNLLTVLATTTMLTSFSGSAQQFISVDVSGAIFTSVNGMTGTTRSLWSAITWTPGAPITVLGEGFALAAILLTP
jgi:hypothetical protein